MEMVIETVVAISGVWIVVVILCSQPWIQRQILYAHRLPIWWGQQLNKPERFGFLKNQVTPFHIPTPDGELLYAWLVSPLRLYAEREPAFLQDEPGFSTNPTDKAAFKFLADDAEARLIVYFHGNAGTVGQTRRTEAYRSLSSTTHSAHVLAFDYRGFGHSSGSPTESGLITDAVTVIKWAMEVANVAPNRIALVAQSLGTGLASAAASHFCGLQPTIEFAGIVLCASFPDAVTVFQNYSVGGNVPLMSPLRTVPVLQKWLSNRIADTWKTSTRIGDLVKKSSRLRLTLIHATNDDVISWKCTNEVFYAAVKATGDERLCEGGDTAELGEAGCSHSWICGDKHIYKHILRHGGTNISLIQAR